MYVRPVSAMVHDVVSDATEMVAIIRASMLSASLATAGRPSSAVVMPLCCVAVATDVFQWL